MEAELRPLLGQEALCSITISHIWPDEVGIKNDYTKWFGAYYENDPLLGPVARKKIFEPYLGVLFNRPTQGFATITSMTDCARTLRVGKDILRERAAALNPGEFIILRGKAACVHLQPLPAGFSLILDQIRVE